MSDANALDSLENGTTRGRASVDIGPPGVLPILTPQQVRLEERLGLNGSKIGPNGLLGGLADFLGEGLEADRFEIQWRASGLTRPGVVAQLTWPRYRTRIGLGIEPPLAHAMVDRLLGFDRLPAEGRLQVTPVEWGILSFVIARSLDRLEESPGPFGDWDLAIDRVGPDPFELDGLGPVVTWRWRVRMARVSASARLWLPESLLALWLLDDPPAPRMPESIGTIADPTSNWKAEAGSIVMSRGLSKLRPGLLLLIDGSPLSGTPESPVGPVELVEDDPSSRCSFRARSVPDSHASRLILETPLRRDPGSREILAVSMDRVDVPSTLVVELGRVKLPLHRLDDLQPGDVIELSRHPREPIELTSEGRLIARAELVQVDTELGVRVTQVFL